MTNSDIVKELSVRFDRPQTEIKILLEKCIQILNETLDDRKISIPDLGTFYARVKKERKSFNPQAQQFMITPPKRQVKYNPNSALMEELKFTEVKNDR